MVMGRETWESWKDTVGGLPSASRKPIVLTGVARQHGTRSQSGKDKRDGNGEELRRLRTSEFKALAINC